MEMHAPDKVWMAPPANSPGEPKQVDATAAALTPLMVLGWRQVDEPEVKIPEQQ